MQKFKFLEHTADVKFQAFGDSLEKAFENSALAFKESVCGKIKIEEKQEKKLKIKGQDNESLLYNFLEELLYLLEAEDFLLSKIKNVKIDRKNFILSAVVSGDRASSYNFTNEVKAVTYSELSVKFSEKNKWTAQVVLDV